MNNDSPYGGYQLFAPPKPLFLAYKAPPKINQIVLFLIHKVYIYIASH